MKKHLIFLCVAFGPNVYAGGLLSLHSKDSEAQDLQVLPLSQISLSFSQFKKDFLEACGRKRVHIDDKTRAFFLYSTHEDEYGRLYIQDLDYMAKYCHGVPKVIMQKILKRISKEDSFFLIAQPIIDPYTEKELCRLSKMSEHGINKALKELSEEDESPSVVLFRKALLDQKALFERK